MPVGYDRDGAVAGLYRVGGCPTFAYAYPGGTLQSASIGELDRGAAERARRAAARGDQPARKRAEMSAGAAQPAMGWEPAPRAGLGGPAHRRRVPRPRDRLGRGRRAAGQEPRAGAAAPARPLRPLLRRRTRSTCANGRSPGPTASSSARSGSTPTAPGPRSSSSPSTGSTTAASRARGLPDDALTIATSRPASRCAPSTPTGSRAGSASATRPRASRWPGGPASCAQGTLVIADERRPVGLLFGATAEGRGVEPRQPPHRDRRDPGQGRARRSPSRRRCGWPPSTLEA